MANKAINITTFLETLTHSRKDDIHALRRIVRKGCPELIESVKWNAPSYSIDGDHRLTFRLHPGDRVEIVFHRGATRRDDESTFSFTDPTGMIDWSTNDRGVIAFPTSEMIHESADDLTELVQSWITATTRPAADLDPRPTG